MLPNSNNPAGARLRQAAASDSHPLQIVGAVNAHHALLARQEGFKAIYLSGAGVASVSLGIPDLGISTMEDVLTDARRITDVCDLPLLVDADTGFGPSQFNIARTVRAFEKAGAAGLHIEDQVSLKRCGHRPGKAVVPVQEMVDRIKAAVDARLDGSFVVMARIDALASEGFESAVERAQRCLEAGADMVFPEAMPELRMYKAFAEAVPAPVLANITEFGKTPLFSLDELAGAGVKLALYPASAFRAMNKAAQNVYRTIRAEGTQRSAINTMQTREELYQTINYYAYENQLDSQV